MKSWGPLIMTASFVAVGLLGSWTWVRQGESLLPLAQGGRARCLAQGGLQAQSEESPIGFILRHKAELGLSADQSEELEAINRRLEGLIASLRSKVQDVINELMALVQADRIDLNEAEAKIREYAALETELSIEKLRAVEKAKAVLRPEQLAKLKSSPLDNGGKGIVIPGRQRGI